MAYIYKNGEELREIAIYAIVSPHDEKIIYLGKTTQINALNKVYSEHYHGRVAATRAMYEKAWEEGKIPAMYLLDTGVYSLVEVYRHTCAWKWYFDHHEYTTIADINWEEGEDTLKPTEAIYAGLRMRPLADVLTPDGGMFPHYGQKPRKSQDKNDYVQISMRLSQAEYQRVKAAAAGQGYTMHGFCRRLVLAGRVIRMDMDNLQPYLDSYADSKQILRSLLYTIYHTKRYYPADLVRIQEHVDNLTQMSIAAHDQISKLYEEVRLDGYEH